jgi:hypothetical protein
MLEGSQVDVAGSKLAVDHPRVQGDLREPLGDELARW